MLVSQVFVPISLNTLLMHCCQLLNGSVSENTLVGSLFQILKKNPRPAFHDSSYINQGKVNYRQFRQFHYLNWTLRTVDFLEWCHTPARRKWVTATGTNSSSKSTLKMCWSSAGCFKDMCWCWTETHISHRFLLLILAFVWNTFWLTTCVCSLDPRFTCSLDLFAAPLHLRALLLPTPLLQALCHQVRNNTRIAWAVWL